jgi:preprotein translocase subunit SecD
MNRYPVWKYAIIVVALLIGVLYTLPNFFGEAPAVQVSAAKAVTGRRRTQRASRDPQAGGHLAQPVTLEGSSVRARFDTTDTQLKAKDAGREGAQPRRIRSRPTSSR